MPMPFSLMFQREKGEAASNSSNSAFVYAPLRRKEIRKLAEVYRAKKEMKLVFSE
jgi:hypothetical protein